MEFFFWIKQLETGRDGTCVRGSLRVPVAVMKHDAKSILGRKGFTWLTGPVTVHHGGKSGQELRAGTEAETLRSTATGLLSLPCSACLLTPPRTASLGVVLLTVGWVLSGNH